MKIPKHYLHDRPVLALLAANAALFLLSFFSVLLGVKPDENPTSIVAYRGTSRIGQISGPTSDLYQFAIFAVIVLVASVVMSMKLYTRRKHLSIGILAMNILLLLMSIIIFNALTTTL